MSLDVNKLMTLSDEDILLYYKEVDESFAIIFARYSRIVFSKVKLFNPMMSEFDDLVQEGYIGLFKAFESYNVASGNKFATYANVCINNNIISALNRVDFHTSDEDFEEKDNFRNSFSPENIVIEKEKIQEVVCKISELLSKKEWTIFRFYLMGYSYQNIALKLDISQKSVNNAMQRIRRKLNSIWKVED